jgi:hypothetical protein
LLYDGFFLFSASGFFAHSGFSFRLPKIH